jgi:antitoxin (DNA-binding transcriptional repressor) of toxin-antitoxin stability system
MKKAGIADLKNNLSRYINYVKGGETVLVLDRKVPVARITPISQGPAAGRKLTDEQRLDHLESIGVLRRGNGNMREWLKNHKPVRYFRGSVLKALLEERESGW